MLSFCFISCFSQLTKRALFVGNSYTAVNNLPAVTASIASALGDTLVYDSNTPGGFTFQMHTTNTTTLSKIAQPGWDYVILQAQSQEPSFPPTQVASNTYPYAKILVDSIRSANQCAEPVFYMTWGRQNGDATNCPIYPPLCTYDGMQGRLRTSYLEMADSNNATCSPVGVAWKQFRILYPSVNLYQSDQSHPSIEGSYLAACVFYSVLFRKSAVGCSYTAGVSASVAANMQALAYSIVSDSADVWNLGHQDLLASFLYSTTGNSVQFTSNSQNADSLLWDFGNGQISNATSSLVAYTPGTYPVTLFAFNECGVDTFIDTLTISSIGISEAKKENRLQLFPNPTTGTFELNKRLADDKISIYNSLGDAIQFTMSEDGRIQLKNVSNGFYFVLVSTESKKEILKLVVNE